MTQQIRPEAGAEISLFGGNITGKVVSAKKPTEFISTWRAPTWPKSTPSFTIFIA